MGKPKQPTAAELNTSSARLTESFLNNYSTATRQAAEQALKSLDTSTNWALTATLGILAFVINALVIKAPVEEQTCELLLIVLGIGYCMLTHFGVRAAKCYLNVIRFAKLEREALMFNLKLESHAAESLLDAIEKYHISWRSPLARWVVFKKVLFELGFFYLGAFMTIAFWFTAKTLPADKSSICVVVILICTLAILLEIALFTHSPYIKDPAPSDDAERKA